MKFRLRTLLILVAIVALLLSAELWQFGDTHFHHSYFRVQWR